MFYHFFVLYKDILVITEAFLTCLFVVCFRVHRKTKEPWLLFVAVKKLFRVI